MINLKCPQCDEEGIVKRWETSVVDGKRCPWCFCPRCQYKWFARSVVNSDSEILDRLEKVFHDQLSKQIPDQRGEFYGEHAEGYLDCMETTAKFVLEFIEDNRETST